MDFMDFMDFHGFHGDFHGVAVILSLLRHQFAAISLLCCAIWRHSVVAVISAQFCRCMYVSLFAAILINSSSQEW